MNFDTLAKTFVVYNLLKPSRGSGRSNRRMSAPVALAPPLVALNPNIAVVEATLSSRHRRSPSVRSPDRIRLSGASSPERLSRSTSCRRKTTCPELPSCRRSSSVRRSDGGESPTRSRNSSRMSCSGGEVRVFSPDRLSPVPISNGSVPGSLSSEQISSLTPKPMERLLSPTPLSPKYSSVPEDDEEEEPKPVTAAGTTDESSQWAGATQSASCSGHASQCAAAKYLNVPNKHVNVIVSSSCQDQNLQHSQSMDSQTGCNRTSTTEPDERDREDGSRRLVRRWSRKLAGILPKRKESNDKVVENVVMKKSMIRPVFRNRTASPVTSHSKNGILRGIHLSQKNKFGVPKEIHAHGEEDTIGMLLEVANRKKTPVRPIPIICTPPRSHNSSPGSPNHNATLPEVLVTLAYSPRSGHLSLRVVRGRYFPENIEFYELQAVLIYDGIHSCQKHSDRIASAPRDNPSFNFPFVFVLTERNLDVAYLTLQFWGQSSLEVVELGAVEFGDDGQPSGAYHWAKMQERPGLPFPMWHRLID